MEDLVKTLKSKIEKHEEKLKAHRSSLDILTTEYDHLKENGHKDLEILEMKIMSTVKNIEYHTGSYKTYKKVVDLIEQKA